MASANGGELPVRIVSRSFVKASDDSIQPHVLAVSNLDLLLKQTMQVSMFCIYPKPSNGDFNDVVAAFASGLPSFLNHFFPFTGRIVANAISGLPEVHCNNQGAELVVGEVGIALRSLDYGTMGMSLRKIQLPHAKDVALSVQLLSFACGGFTVGWATDHVLVDGHALCMLVGAWSELARSRTLAPASRPNHDRSVFRSRATPTYSAALDESFTPLLDGGQLVNVLTTEQSFVERLYYIEASDIARLREAASRDGERATRVQAVSAYLWKALAAAVGTADAHCRMGCVEELHRKQLLEVASMAREAITAPAYYERFQELVDWMEEHKSGARYVKKAMIVPGSPVVGVSLASSFPLDTDFGFGDAAMAMPTMTSGSAKLCSGFMLFAARPAVANPYKNEGWARIKI
ncbi:hypothetical protein ABZP36_014708 [Zizania latifolia]